MPRKKLRKVRLVRMNAEDERSICQWAREHGVTEAAVIRDLIRRERLRREWADRDNMARVENAHAELATERAA